MPTIQRGVPSAPGMASASPTRSPTRSVATTAPDESTVAPASPKTATTLPTSATALTRPTCAVVRVPRHRAHRERLTAPAARVCGAGPHPRSSAAAATTADTTLHARRSSGTTSPSRMYLRGSTPNAARNVASRSGGAMARSPSVKRRTGCGRSWSGSVLPEDEVRAEARRDDERGVVRVVVAPHAEVDLRRPAEVADHEDVRVLGELGARDVGCGVASSDFTRAATRSNVSCWSCAWAR